MDNRQFEEFLEGIEIPIAVQEGVPRLEAEGRDQAIDGLTDSMAALPERPVIAYCR